jgi:hypothetical protein
MTPDVVSTALMFLCSVLPSMLAYFSTAVTYNCKKFMAYTLKSKMLKLMHEIVAGRKKTCSLSKRLSLELKNLVVDNICCFPSYLLRLTAQLRAQCFKTFYVRNLCIFVIT